MNEVLLVDVEEAGRRLGIRRSKAYELVMSQRLGSVKIGKLRRVPVAALEEYVRRLSMDSEEHGEAASQG